MSIPIGLKHTEESKEKNRLAHLGKIPWNKGKAGTYELPKGRTISQQHREKISISLRGNIPWNKGGAFYSDETRNKMSNAKKGKVGNRLGSVGKKLSIEERKHLSNKMKGENAPNWKGGKTIEAQVIRQSLEYRLWREAVFARDNYTCVFCLQRGVVLNADHIKPFARYPELRFAIDNGRTLCVPCHKTTDTYGNKSSNKYGK